MREKTKLRIVNVSQLLNLKSILTLRCFQILWVWGLGLDVQLEIMTGRWCEICCRPRGLARDSVLLIADLSWVSLGLLLKDETHIIHLSFAKDSCWNELGSLLVDVKELSRNVFVVFSFVSRICNSIAHELACYAISSCNSHTSEMWNSLLVCSHISY